MRLWPTGRYELYDNWNHIPPQRINGYHALPEAEHALQTLQAAAHAQKTKTDLHILDRSDKFLA